MFPVICFYCWPSVVFKAFFTCNLVPAAGPSLGASLLNACNWASIFIYSKLHRKPSQNLPVQTQFWKQTFVTNPLHRGTLSFKSFLYCRVHGICTWRLEILSACKGFLLVYIFWQARVRWPLLCLCRPFCIFERCLDSIPVSCRSKQAR